MQQAQKPGWKLCRRPRFARYALVHKTNQCCPHHARRNSPRSRQHVSHFRGSSDEDYSTDQGVRRSLLESTLAHLCENAKAHCLWMSTRISSLCRLSRCTVSDHELPDGPGVAALMCWVEVGTNQAGRMDCLRIASVRDRTALRSRIASSVC